MATDEGGDSTITTLLGDAIELSDRCGRGDLVRHLRIAEHRLGRPEAVVCVVGEFKQGKSAFVNALVGQAVCPVDDDLATSAVTLVTHAPAATATVQRTEADGPVVEQIPFASIARFASERGNPGNELGVDLIEIGLPSSVLGHGLAAIDTPGVGALRRAPARALTEFLQYADALILVTDASAELSAPEMRLLDQARAVCPTVLVALSKIDLYPEWRRIAELDATHLRPLGLSDAVIGISSPLRMRALQTGDAELNDRSGFPLLLSAVRSRIIDRARSQAADRAVADVERAATGLAEAIRHELGALADPAAARERLAELETAQQRLRALQAAGSRWVTALNDGFTDLRSELEYRLRTVMRSLIQRTDDRLVGRGKRHGWDEIADDLQEHLMAEAMELLDAAHDAADDIATRIADIIETDTPETVRHEAESFDSAGLWPASPQGQGGRRRVSLGSSLTALRGGYSGMLMLGMLSQLAGLTLAMPITLGAGAVFGAKQVLDERKRLADRRRQEARTAVRTFLGQAQDEIGTRLRQSIQDRHRALRDHFAEEIGRLADSTAATVRSLQSALQTEEADRQRRVAALEETAAMADSLADRARNLAADQGAA